MIRKSRSYEDDRYEGVSLIYIVIAHKNEEKKYMSN